MAESQSSRLILSLRRRGWAVKLLSPSAAFVRSSAPGAAERSRACAGAHTLRGGRREMPSTRSVDPGPFKPTSHRPGSDLNDHVAPTQWSGGGQKSFALTARGTRARLDQLAGPGDPTGIAPLGPEQCLRAVGAPSSHQRASKAATVGATWAHARALNNAL